MTKRKIEAQESSGNVFADLGLPDSEDRLLKAGIVAELHRLIKERELTQVKAAKLVGISNPISRTFCVVTSTIIPPSG